MGIGIPAAHASDWQCCGDMGTVDALADIIRLLEAELPANPRSPANERLEDSMFADVARYFRALRETFPYDAVDMIYYANVREAGEKETVDAFDPTLQAVNATWTARMVSQWATIYVRGTAQVTKWAGLPFEGAPWERAITWADKHGSTAITKMTSETQRQIGKIVSDGIKNKRGIEGIQRDIRTKFAEWGRISEVPISRARMIARTESSSALGEAFLDRAAELGIPGKSLAVFNPCPICIEADRAGVIPLKEAFPGGRQRPPFHPNAVFAESPFIIYGSLAQIVRSRYNGPATRIETDRISFTIGPNHPILTGRGWIKASGIHEGEQLVYDTRAERPGMHINEAYLYKVPSVQEVFDSLMAAFGYATVASPRAYFHGDEVFAYGKVDVVLPTVDLLPILDTSGIEQFSEDDFLRAYANAFAVPSGRPRRNAANGVLVSPPSDMRSLGLMESLFRGHAIPSPFKSTTVTHVQASHYDGWAYDASTSTSLYNSSGIVVKNCRCALVPERLPR